MDRLISYLNSLDDDYYFFIANTFLGKVSTPFHKPVINGSIVSFLLNGQNRENIIASLNVEDRRLLTLIRMVGESTASSIAAFFPDESYHIVMSGLESLRDRLILLTEKDTYFINPVLEDAVSQCCDPDLVFGQDSEKSEPLPIVDRNVLFSILNLLSNGSIPPREANVHHFTKSDRLQRVFPQFAKQTSLAFLTSIKAMLVSSGAAIPSVGRFRLDRERAREILELDDLNLAVAAIGREHGEALSKLLGILKIHSLIRQQALAVLQMFTDPEKCEAVLSSAACFGLLSEENGRVRLNPAVLQENTPMSRISVDSDLEVDYFGVPGSDDILYLFADIEVCDNLVRYRITKESFFRALDLGMDPKDIQSYIGTSRFDGLFSMWLQSFSRITLYDGITVRCGSGIGSVVRQHPKIAPHIIADLGDGTFVMDRSVEWQQHLAYSIDLPHLPMVRDASVRSVRDPEISSLSFRLDPPEVGAGGIWHDNGEAIRKELLDDAKAKGCLTDDVKALIDARLIISKSQISRGFRYAGMQTIGGFDYSAKLTAIRNLMKKKNPPMLKLELSDDTILVQPVELVRGSGIIKVKVLPQGTEKAIPVSSIFRATVMRWTLS